jgi:hypothetical protein
LRALEKERLLLRVRLDAADEVGPRFAQGRHQIVHLGNKGVRGVFLAMHDHAHPATPEPCAQDELAWFRVFEKEPPQGTDLPPEEGALGLHRLFGAAVGGPAAGPGGRHALEPRVAAAAAARWCSRCWSRLG